MQPLPEQPQPDAGQRPVSDNAARFLAELEEAMAGRTSFRDPTPPPAIGPTPPVPQPGRPPMSQRAVDVSGVMLAGSVASVPVGGMACLVLWFLDQVNPVSLAIAASAPAALVLAVSQLMRRARPEPEVHHHYEGPTRIDQRQTHSKTSGVWAHTSHKGRER